jgi:hypothetical protein
MFHACVRYVVDFGNLYMLSFSVESISAFTYVYCVSERDFISARILTVSVWKKDGSLHNLLLVFFSNK